MTMQFKVMERLSVAAAAGLAILAAAFCEAQDDVPPPTGNAAGQAAAVEADANVEVLTSGPVHEAFANPLTLQAEEGLVISEAPPEPIDELPPEVMPAGNNVEWIPGYWAWDEDRNGFLWVSGLWRDVPPDQRWVPGYWAQVGNGYRWVTGFWTEAASRNLDYLPYPPESQEVGPNIAAPGEGYFWIPGSWVYTGGDYQWRPGYWAQAYDDWVWVPQRYVWTPRGAIFTAGYWDYRVPYRGTLFAPVYFRDYTWFRGGRRFTPGYVVNPAGLLVSLFVRPRYGHYYFGNYYGDEFYQRGFYPWYDASFGGQYRYDPLLAFYESYYDRRGIDFSGRINQWYTFYDRNPDRRPARTWSESVQLASRADADTTIRLAQPLDEFVSADREGRREFRRLNEEQRTAFAEASTDFRGLLENRGRVETEARVDGRERDRDLRDADPRPDAQRPRDDAQPDPSQRGDRPDRADRQQRGDSRGLELPQFRQRGRDILGEARDEAGQRRQPGEADDRRQTPPGQERQRGDDARRGADADEGRRSRFQPPERPQFQPPERDGRAPDATPSPRDRGDRAQDNRARQPQPEGADRQRRPEAADRQPSRNMFQPRRGNFGERGPEGIDRSQRPQLDPRDTIPQFRGRGQGSPNQAPGQDARQGRGRSGNPPAANPNQGSPNQGNRGNAPGNRGGGNRGGVNPGPGNPGGANPGGPNPGGGNPGNDNGTERDND
jgi:hypothetical protein